MFGLLRKVYFQYKRAEQSKCSRVVGCSFADMLLVAKQSVDNGA